MAKRRWVIATAALAVTVSACARAPIAPAHLGVQTPALSAPVGRPTEVETGRGGEVPTRNLASKVLAAMALERVTGRKPDPIHFVERP